MSKASDINCLPPAGKGRPNLGEVMTSGCI